MTLEERCRAFLQEQDRQACMKYGSPVRDLVAFVLAERGRTAEEALPLVLYFTAASDRDKMIAAIREMKSDCVTLLMP